MSIFTTYLINDVNPKKCELTILNHTKEEKIQTFERFKELLPELKLVPAA